MALVSDLCRPGLLQPVALIQQLFFGGPETVKEARSSPDGVCPVHLILEDKVRLVATVQCTLKTD